MTQKQNSLRTYANIEKVNPDDPQPFLIKKAADIVTKGDVISFPTRCLYGLAADAFNTNAVRNIYRIKQRPYEKPILVLVKNREHVDQLVTSVPASAEIIIKKFWPGNVTLIFNARTTLPSILTSGTGKIGIRMPAHKVAMALCQAVKNPITGTSANLSGHAGCSQVSDFKHEIMQNLALVLDAGPLKGGIGSTIIDVTMDPPQVLREGKVLAKEIFKLIY